MFHIHERFLRHIWAKQYLAALELQTTDGRSLQVLLPGTSNPDAGPDYLDARIRIDGKTLFGDVELHKRGSDWNRHGHSHDRRYNKVVLHVVLYDDDNEPAATESGRVLPQLCLQRFLDDSFRVIWDRSIADDRAERSRSLPCTGITGTLSPDDVFQWIGHLAYERLELKLRRFDGRLKEIIDEHRLAVREPRLRYYGDIDEIPIPNQDYTAHDFAPRWIWEQALYEGLFEALGYSKNREPFLKLARNVSLDYIKDRLSFSPSDPGLTLQSIYFGIAGFIRSATCKSASGSARDTMLRTVWEEHALSYTKEKIEEAEWTYFRLRPNNFPDRRLEAGIVLVRRIVEEELLRKLTGVFTSGENAAACISNLRSLLMVRSEGEPTLLGRPRVDDMIVNTLLPLISLYSRIFREPKIREAIREIYARYPSMMDNGSTRFVRRSVPGISENPRGALVQQGMLHLYNFYCTEKRCSECTIGQRVFQTKAD